MSRVTGRWKNSWIRISVVFLFLVIASLAYAGSYEDGYAAYEKGNYTIAIQEFRMAAEEGNADAQFILGFMYHSGRGATLSSTKAVKWVRMAAEQGHARAQAILRSAVRGG